MEMKMDKFGENSDCLRIFDSNILTNVYCTRTLSNFGNEIPVTDIDFKLLSLDKIFTPSVHLLVDYRISDVVSILRRI